MLLGASLGSEGQGSASERSGLTTWWARLDLGFQLTVRRLVTFNLAAGLSTNFLYEGAAPTARAHSPELDLTVHLGAIQSLQGPPRTRA